MRECQQCGKSYEGNFCPYCGAKWTEEAPTEHTCPDCGTVASAGMRFCANCGYDFAGKKSFDTEKEEKQMRAALLRTENFMETIPSMLRIGNAVLCLIFSVLLWFLFALPVTTILGESVGSLYQFMNGTTILGELLGRFSEITWVMLLAVAASLYALTALCISIDGRKKKNKYVSDCFLNLGFLVFHIVFFAIGCILHAKVSDFGLAVGACATALIVCSVAFFVISLALMLPALVLSARVPLSAKEMAEREAKRAVAAERAKKILPPLGTVAVVALIVMAIVSYASNIFRAEKVDDIAIGDSKQTVLDILGEPYEKRTETDFVYAEYVSVPYDDVWKYYSEEFTDLFDKMDDVKDKTENSDSVQDIGGLVGIGGVLGDTLSVASDALKLHYKYIEVAFKDGAVVAVYLDKDKTAQEELDGELKKKSDVASASFAPFEYTGCSGGGYGTTYMIVRYHDGSYAHDRYSVEVQDSKLLWKDFKGKQEYYPGSSLLQQNATLGTMEHACDTWDTTNAATCTEEGKKKGYCDRCQNHVSQAIPAKGHQNQNGTCSACSLVLSLGNEKYIFVDEHGVRDEGGNYLLFGEYPQSLKAEGVTVGTTADSRGYYLGSDGFYYAKVTADPFNSGYKFSSGASVTNGTVYYFKVEPIRWRILSESGDTALILCDSIIANHRYDESNNNYKSSEIRAWLNGTFYNTAFNELQKDLINTVLVDNSEASTGYSSNPYACEDTSDKVFLLSYKEVTNPDYGFSSNDSDYDTARRMTVNDYARATGAYMNEDNGWWWLRSPSTRHDSNARGVSHDGYVGYYGVNYELGGVVPALQIRLR